MTKLATALLISIPFGAHRAEASAPQECQVRVLAPITDDLGNTWKTGSVLPVDIERDGPQGGAFCAHGGSCLSQLAGAQPVLTLLNCKVGPALGGGDYRLLPSARQAGPVAAASLKALQDTTAKLMALGFSNASSAKLANVFLVQPHSNVGQLIAKALGGSRSASATLKRNNP